MATGDDPLGLLGSECLGERRRRSRLQHPGPHDAELTELAGVKARWRETEEAGLRQLVGDALSDGACSCAETQVLADCSERRVDRRPRAPSLPAVRSRLEEVLEASQVRQADRGPVDAAVVTPAEEPRDPPGVDADRMWRRPGSVECTQEVACLSVDDEVRIEHHPDLGPVERRQRAFGSESAHVTNVNVVADRVADTCPRREAQAAEMVVADRESGRQIT